MTEGADLVGRTIAGRFTIEAHVGSGAMGDVYRARHNALGSTVALKIMRPDIAKDAMFRERFYREAKAASRLEHPNSVRVIDFGHEPDGLVYLAMEFLAGRDLLAMLRESWPIDDERIVDILSQVLAALSVAHNLGIVHRDLKPENIMVLSTKDEDDGGVHDQVKVCDFGIAKLSDPRAFKTENDGKALTSSGTLIGTPEYMSPEQARGDTLDARSDLYSVGIILYQMLTGRVPFTAENTLGVVLKQVTDEPVPPSAIHPAVDRRLEAICLRALKKPREARYQTAKEMRADLRAALPRQPYPSSEESGRWLPAVPSTPEITHAPTLAHAPAQAEPKTRADTVVAPVASGRELDFAPKETSNGTELTVAPRSRRASIGLVAGVAVVALLVGAVAVVAVGMRRSSAEHDGPSASTATAKATASPSAVVAARGSPAAGEPSAAAAASSPVDAPLAPSAKSAAAGPQAHGGRTAAAKSSATPPSSLAARSSEPAPSAPPPVEPPAPSAAPPGPPYNPASAFVSLGGLTTERVRADAVRQKMGELLPRLSECYRTSLRMTGAPVGGQAQVHLSIDERGTIQGIVNAPKHPEFARCAQNALAGQKIAASALESPGATAEQSLSLVP